MEAGAGEDKIMSLDLIDLGKTYGRRAEERLEVLQHIDCRIEKGRFVSITGPSGCGKTTLLRILAGLEEASTGRVLLQGKELTRSEGKVGLVFQEYALFPWRTARKNVEFPLEILGVKKKARALAAMEYLEAFGLEAFGNKYPAELSGGMQQRVAIARTLISNPDVILMDEPFGALDSQTRNALQAFLLNIWLERRETVLFVTHNVDEAVFLSDQIIVMSERPSRIIKVLEVPCARPRDRTSRECNRVRKQVLNLLK